MGAAVVAVFVAAVEALTEIVLILAQVHVVTIVTVAAILVAEGVLRIKAPAVFAIRLARAKTFRVTVVDRLTEHVRAVAIGFVVTATAVVAIVVWSIVVVAPTLQTQLVLPQTREVGLLVAQLRAAALLLQNALPLQGVILLTLPFLAILAGTAFLTRAPVALLSVRSIV